MDRFRFEGSNVITKNNGLSNQSISINKNTSNKLTNNFKHTILDNDIIEICKYMYCNNTKLKKVGSLKEYISYTLAVKEGEFQNMHGVLHTNSKVKEIVRHGTASTEPIQNFSKDFLGTSNHFATEKDVEGFFFDPDYPSCIYTGYEIINNKIIQKGRSYAILINIENAQREYEDTWVTEKGKQKKGIDGIINIYDKKPGICVVFDPHNIHILGADLDIEGFKKWKESKK